jgi:DNA repair exonuclease SbcCD nuclease subunit
MIDVLDSKVGCFSDIHIGLYQDSPEWHDISLEFAKKASEFYKKNKIKTIVIAGDVFHNRSEISVRTIHSAKKFFDYFKDFQIIISVGNHDCFYKEKAEINSISILDGWDNIKIVDESPLVLTTKQNTSVSFIPWGVECKDIPKTDICFGHFEINTFYMNSYRACEKGEDSKNLLDKSPFVISGHFHKRDHRVYEKGQILYLGSPYQHNFGDVDDERGYYIIDLDKSSFEFFENNFSPKFIKLKTEDLNKKTIEKKIKNNFVSLNLDSSLKQEDTNNFLMKVMKYGPLNIKTEYTEKQDIKQNEEKTYDCIDILENINEYVKTLDIECKEEVINYLTEIYNTLNK